MTTVGEYMRAAMKEAETAMLAGEVPVGAVVVRNGEIIARAGNRCEQDNDPTAHAEILAIRAAAKAIGDWRLTDCSLYVTLEPCCMCAGAIKNARVRRVIFGAWDKDAGCCGSRADVRGLGAEVDIAGGILEQECAAMLSKFFETIR